MTGQLVFFVIRNVLVTATFVEVLRCVFCINFDVLFRDKLTQETDRILAVNGAVALTRLLYVTLLARSQLRTHPLRFTSGAAVYISRLFATQTRRVRKSVCSCFKDLNPLGIFKNALALVRQKFIVGPLRVKRLRNRFSLCTLRRLDLHVFGVNHPLCYRFYDTFHTRQLTEDTRT